MSATESSSQNRMDPVLNLLKQRPREDWRWTFEADAAGHSAANALALCNAALLTYSDPTGVQHFLKNWEFEEPQILQGSDTQGFVARRENIIIVAFRGTEPVNAHDWISDFKYHQRSLLPEVPGLVHGGFADAIEKVNDTMCAAVKRLSRADAPRLFVTGHSLGGALAVLAAAVLRFCESRDIAAVYTYGQPRVGDPKFSAAYDQALRGVTFRYVNDLDIVPHVPPEKLPKPPEFHLSSLVSDALHSPMHALEEIKHSVSALLEEEQFAHVGQLKLFLSDGTLTDDEQQWRDREAIPPGRLADLLDELPGLVRGKLRQEPLGIEAHRIIDHDPLNGYLPKLENQASKSSGGAGT
jgi:triacylglycerol lipase